MTGYLRPVDRAEREASVRIRDDNGMQRGVPIHPRPVKGSGLETAGHTNSAEKTPGDRVELSDRARALQVAKEALAKLPDVRVEEVERLKQMVRADAYKVPAAEVAGRMLGEGIFG
jgi:flagellar biosynthesis anti-sigma factor FlgM